MNTLLDATSRLRRGFRFALAGALVCLSMGHTLQCTGLWKLTVRDIGTATQFNATTAQIVPGPPTLQIDGQSAHLNRQLTFSFSGLRPAERDTLAGANERAIFDRGGPLPQCNPVPPGHGATWLVSSPPEAANALRFNYCVGLGNEDATGPRVAELQVHQHPSELTDPFRQELNTARDPDLKFRRVVPFPQGAGHHPRWVAVLGERAWAVLDLQSNQLVDLDPGAPTVYSVCYETGAPAPCTAPGLLGGHGGVIVSDGGDAYRLYVTHAADEDPTLNHADLCGELTAHDMIGPAGAGAGNTVSRYSLSLSAGTPLWGGDRALIVGSRTAGSFANQGFCAPADIVAGPAGSNELYVAHFRTGAMSVIDTTTDTIKRTFARPIEIPFNMQQRESVRSRNLAVGEVDVDVYDDQTGAFQGTFAKSLVFMFADHGSGVSGSDTRGFAWAIDPTRTETNRIVAKFVNLGAPSTAFAGLCSLPAGQDSACGTTAQPGTSKVGRTPQGIAFYEAPSDDRKFIALVNSTPSWNGKQGYLGEEMTQFVTNLAVIDVTRLRSQFNPSDTAEGVTNGAVIYDLNVYVTTPASPSTRPNTAIPIADGRDGFTSIGRIAVNSRGDRAYVSTFEKSVGIAKSQNGGLLVFNLDLPEAPGGYPIPPAIPGENARTLLEQYLGRFGPLGKVEEVRLLRPADGVGGDWVLTTALAPGVESGAPAAPVLAALPEPIVVKRPVDGPGPLPEGTFYLAASRPTDLILTGQGPGGMSRIQFMLGNGFVQAEESFGDEMNPSGEVRISHGDVDGDGAQEVLLTYGGAILDEEDNPVAVVFVIETDGSDTTFYVPTGYDQADGGLSLTAGDVDGDGVDEIITADRRPSYFPGTQTPYYPVKIFDFDPVTRTATYQTHFHGAEGVELDDGIDVAVGEFDADSRPEIVVSFRGDYDDAGTPRTAVRVFDDDASPGTYAEKFGFFPLSGAAADQGVTVATGDVDADGDDEIVLGQRGTTMVDLDEDGTPETPGNLVLVFDRSNNWSVPTKTLTVFLGDEATGANVATGNFDADASAEIVVGQGPGATSRSLIRLYGEEGTFGTLMTTLTAYAANETATAGVNVAAGR